MCSSGKDLVPLAVEDEEQSPPHVPSEKGLSFWTCGSILSLKTSLVCILQFYFLKVSALYQMLLLSSHLQNLWVPTSLGSSIHWGCKEE